MRVAIDRYKDAADLGQISPLEVKVGAEASQMYQDLKAAADVKIKGPAELKPGEGVEGLAAAGVAPTAAAAAAAPAARGPKAAPGAAPSIKAAPGAAPAPAKAAAPAKGGGKK